MKWQQQQSHHNKGATPHRPTFPASSSLSRRGNLGDAQTKETPESADPETKMDGSEAIHLNHVASATEVQHSEETASAAATSLNETASERMPFFCALRVRQATCEIWHAVKPKHGGRTYLGNLHREFEPPSLWARGACSKRPRPGGLGRSLGAIARSHHALNGRGEIGSSDGTDLGGGVHSFPDGGRRAG